MANSQNISVGKPLVGGAVYRGAVSATLPTSALTTLSADFTSLGFISEDGLTNESTFSSTEFKDWGGNVVMTSLDEKKDTFKFKLIESLNVDVLKTIFGDSNVSGSLAEGITVNVKATELDTSAYVIDMLMTGGYIKRIVIPKGKISEVAEVTYKKDEVVGYECTITALLDDSDNSHYEYIAKPETSVASEE